ncbi:MAG: indolepyruvate oxidoreductase subunit beta [Parasporobacterium sp.]|nr:indolepyruvate oxidoreductase subunit beta [Parasporobacterium sp.]
MTKSIILVGVGGQGTITTSSILARGLIAGGKDVKMSEIHGMSQRGGTVVTQVKYGEKVYSPIIGEGEADLIVSFEKVEALRALPYLKEGGTVVTDIREIFPMPVLTGAAAYPGDAIEQMQKSVPNVIVVRAAELAQQLGNVKAQNIVLLGALVKQLGLMEIDWRSIIRDSFPEKLVDLNLKAFEAGTSME